MKVEVFADGVTIGFAELEELDPSMGVAVGHLTPTSAYQASAHAGELDGEENTLPPTANFAVRGPHGLMECVGVWIMDAKNLVGEIQVSILGISGFETHFADHPQFRN